MNKALYLLAASLVSLAGCSQKLPMQGEAAPEMTSPRIAPLAFAHQSTLIVIGGEDRFGRALDSAEAWDSAAEGTWEAHPWPGGAIAEASVLTLEDGSTLLVGGRNDETTFDTCWRYDGSWASCGTLPEAVAGTRLVTTAAGVLAVGGRREGEIGSTMVALFDGSSSWTALPDLTQARYNHALALRGDDVWVGGGEDETGFLSDAEIVHTDGRPPSDTLRLPRPRGGFNAWTDNAGKTWVSAGDSPQGVLGSVLYHDGGDGAWVDAHRLSDPREGTSLINRGDYALSLGGGVTIIGANGRIFSEIVKIEQGQAEVIGRLHTPRSFAAHVELGDEIFLIGGSSSRSFPLDVVERITLP